MAYDEELAERVRMRLAREPGLHEKRMFGGLAFLLDGRLSVSVSRTGGLLLRCHPDDADTFVAQPHVERFVMRGRAMDGWLRVDPAGIEDDPDLYRWVAVGVAFARSLPPK